MKNWRFIVFLILLAIVMIANTQRFEQKFSIAKLTTEVKELRSEFVDRRSQLMKLKMESTVSENGGKQIFHHCSSNKKVKKKKKTFLKKIWQ
jgi:hypothetical protein